MALKDWIGKVFDLLDPRPWVSVFGTETYSGKVVTRQSALQLSVAWACIRLIAETYAQLPVHIVEKRDGPFGSERHRVTDHPLVPILEVQRNRFMTPTEESEAVLLNLLTDGNSYEEVEYNPRGDVIALNPLTSSCMSLRADGGELFYDYSTTLGEYTWQDGRGQIKAPGGAPAGNRSRILHTRLFSFDGIVGLSPIAYARQALGLSLAAEETGARFYRNGWRPSGFITTDKVLQPEQRKGFEEALKARQEDLGNRHSLVVLESGFKFERGIIPPDEAQFLETRQFQVPEICRFYLVQPHKVMDLARATNNNIEEQGREFLQTTMMPYIVRREQRLRLLFKPEDRARFQIKHEANALSRGNMQAQAEYFTKLVGGGIMDRNEARGLIDLNPRAGGDQLTVQKQMIDLDDLQNLPDRRES